MSDDDRLLQFEIAIGRVLRAGVLASSACLVCGLALELRCPGAGAGLMRVGLLVLIATPSCRVVLSVVEYLKERDWPFAALTLVVLIELAASVVAALVFRGRL